ncbi:Hypothetical Protein FCC1311_070602 [Hondaea fermentalgiana]|uniref:Transmembrane protein n=1 Tax=Hondaea fermentalgiana TaxID=2315210 RepID=A0A2R5GIX7_9STRA|nr:Hypothetical Protein FCC1311_070602 [Hondaea fermentalgiana]|eukprot:GBG30840.1 Hypothetical Protein FCC1311_070602 [Hondaea fermentalgiana]
MARNEIRTEKRHKRPPGPCWYLWACFNNERTYLLGIPIVNLALTLGLMGLLLVNRVVDYVDAGTTQYLDVFAPSFSDYVTYTEYGNCSVGSSDVTVLFTSTPGWNAKSILFMFFLVIAMLMSFPLIWFTYKEYKGDIALEELESGHRFLLLAYIAAYVLINFIVLIIGADSSYAYFYGCYNEVLSAIQSLSSSAATTFASVGTPMLVIFSLSWVLAITSLLLFLVALCLLGTPRPFYDPIAWDPQLELSRGG